MNMKKKKQEFEALKNQIEQIKLKIKKCRMTEELNDQTL